MWHRFHGDVFIFRITEESGQHVENKGSNRNVIYDNAPDDLLHSRILQEMMAPTKWKVLPNGGNVAMLGFYRFGMLQLQQQ